MNKAQKACHHALKRCVIDRNFSWLMWGTETMQLCMEAEAQRRGISREDVQKEISDASKEYDAEMIRTDREERTKTEVQELRRRNRKLRDKIAKLSGTETGSQMDTRMQREFKASDSASLSRVQDLMREAELRGGNVTTEQLADAIAGNHVFF